MKKLLFCVLAFLAPFLLASDISFSLVEQDQKNDLSQQTIQSTSFNILPFEIKKLVFQQVPLGYLLICREWMQMAKELHEVDLSAFLTDLEFFGAVFNSYNAKYEIRYVKQRFTTPERMHQMISKVIASFYDKAVESERLKGNSVEPDSVKSLVNQSIEAFLGESRLIDHFIELLLESDDRKRLVFDLLRGKDNFREIPLEVRLSLAKSIWSNYDSYDHICPLSSFLSSFHDKFDKLKDYLVDISPKNMARACVKIALGIDCTMLSIGDRMRLLGSIKQLFSKDPLIQTAYLFCEELSPNLLILDILEVTEKYPRLRKITFDALENSSEHANAVWCMRKSNRTNSLLEEYEVRTHWLFNRFFLERQGLLGTESELLEGCKVSYLLDYLPDVLTGLDTQALVKWANDNIDFNGRFSFDSLVILYSLDEDIDALGKYSESLLALSKEPNNLCCFSPIVLGTDFGQYLNRDKKMALLQLLYPEILEAVKTYLDGDRKKLLFKVASLLDKRSYSRLASYRLPKSDFLLLVEACLESSGTCNVPPLLNVVDESAVQVLLKYIGDNVKKAAGLQYLHRYYQAMVFLLTDNDGIAKSLIENECFKHLNWNCYSSRIHSDWQAFRAAKRIHEYRSNQSQHTETDYN